MKKKLTKATNQSSGSISNCKHYLFAFGHSHGTWAKYFKGFTHLILVEWRANGLFIVHDPLVHGHEVDILINNSFYPKPNDLPFDHTKYVLLGVDIIPTKTNKLFGFKFQTCASILQYIAGISLGCVTVQGLYERLTDSSTKWLKSKGIMEVQRWATSSRP